jgi:hypothetical protein
MDQLAFLRAEIEHLTSSKPQSNHRFSEGRTCDGRMRLVRFARVLGGLIEISTVRSGGRVQRPAPAGSFAVPAAKPASRDCRAGARPTPRIGMN